MNSFNDNNFKLRFDGEQHQLDANVLISSLIHTTTIIQELNRYFDSGKKIEIKVKALEKGSFQINIELIETVIDSLKTIFTKENIEIGSLLITSFVGLIEIKKFLKGKKPSKIETKESKSVIFNENGDTLIIENSIINIYEQNATIKDALSQNFEVINNDPAINAFEVTDKNEKPLIRIEKEEFSDMSLKSEEILKDERILKEAATLNIVRLSFEESLKWEFFFKGNKISAKINDPNFFNLIDKGEAFAKGDVLEVELQINQKWDDSVNTYINKSYQVNRIIRHILRNEQQKFEFEE
ncbi:MAG: hypothetical protein LLF95_00885 [Bacteroidales bacterium]|nr:hypothetical protein [Bacteroidales bacterium]